MWIDAAAVHGIQLGAVLLVRHPFEVAASLATRDGISIGRGLLLWLDYTLAAVAQAEKLPSVVLEYGQLLQDWKECVLRVSTLPGATSLARNFENLDPNAIPDLAMRHQRALPESISLPRIIGEVWDRVLQMANDGHVAKGTYAWLEELVAPVRELIQPMLGEWRLRESTLWERVAKAESSDVGSKGLQDEISALKDRAELHHAALIDAISVDIKHMQSVTSAALAQAEVAKHEASLSNDMVPLLRKLGESQDLIVGRVQDELNRSAKLTEAQNVMFLEWKSGADEKLQKMMNDVEEARVSWTDLLVEHGNKVMEVIEKDREHATSVESKLAELSEKLAGYEGLLAQRNQLQRALAEQARAHEEELGSLRYDLGRLSGKANLLDQVVASRSWRWTRPLRFLRRLLSGEIQPSDRVEVRRMLGLPGTKTAVSSVRSDAGVLPALATYAPDLPDVFVWAVIDWHFRFQRPQHLAQALAKKGHRVFYISNNLLDSASAGFAVEPLDDGQRLFQVNLHLAGAPAIYHGMPNSIQSNGLRASFAKLLAWTGSPGTISIVQHPFWSELARIAPNGRVVYDCMDHHAGFENNAPAVLAAEEQLVNSADLVVVTSEWLEKELNLQGATTSIIRNAAEYEFFRHRPERVFKDPKGRRVVGYYGAIAEWFDLELVRVAAQALPDVLFVLVGHDTVGAAAVLKDLGNVELVGERPYQELPFWLHGFDVCLLPFKIIPLTLATNPVKVYEYLSAGKPTVAVDLPEMAQFDGLVGVAHDNNEFVSLIRKGIDESSDGEMMERRQAFAAQQTWGHRAEALDDAIESRTEPLVSLIVLTYNNLAFTEACLFSIEAYSDYRNLEVIVVDNASSDGSRDWLKEWAAESSPSGHKRRLVLNDENLGFAGGNNVGLRTATGEYLVILNNDTYVTPGWVRTLCAHLRHDPKVGLVGPVTNNIGNEARVEIQYSDMVEMLHRAGAYTRARPGESFPIRTAAFFCVAMRRQTYRLVGDMDEDFGVGFFEDDDYCRRVQNAGLEIVCADDVFIHHHLSASFDKMKVEKKKELFERNKAIYEAKWGEWKPHEYRK